MMRFIFSVVLIGCFFFDLQAQSWEVTPLTPLPEAVTNNAVCEGFIVDTTFLYTFGGLDESKIYAGIHLRCYRYNTISKIWQSIPDLPDTEGKIAAGASRIGDTIYIIGGYHVASNGNETSSKKIHRFQISSNTFLSDGPDIPKAIDDHVQAIWKDSLIYIITGWSNTSNVPNVQIYNPTTNHWTSGTSLPNTNKYKSFGASGTIIGDTIYYFGGARYSSNFPIQSDLRIGIIDPENPSQINWSITKLVPESVGYRMAATQVNGKPIWIGGSNITYNYNGIAYNGSGGVLPSNTSVYINDVNNPTWTTIHNTLPMDLRGIASQNDTIKFLVGGLIDNQVVSNQLLQLTWKEAIVNNHIITKPVFYRLSPNPTTAYLELNFEAGTQYPVQIQLTNYLGQLLLQTTAHTSNHQIDLGHIPRGSHLLQIKNSLYYRTEWISLK